MQPIFVSTQRPDAAATMYPLSDKFPLKRPLQNRLSEAAGDLLEAGIYDRFKFLHRAQAALHFGDIYYSSGTGIVFL